MGMRTQWRAGGSIAPRTIVCVNPSSTIGDEVVQSTAINQVSPVGVAYEGSDRAPLGIASIYSTGTVSATASATITGSGTTFTASMVGATLVAGNVTVLITSYSSRHLDRRGHPRHDRRVDRLQHLLRAVRAQVGESVRVYGVGEVATVTTSTAGVTVGDYVYSDVNGYAKTVPLTTGSVYFVVGMVLETALGGEAVPILIMPAPFFGGTAATA